MRYISSVLSLRYFTETAAALHAMFTWLHFGLLLWCYPDLQYLPLHVKHKKLLPDVIFVIVFIINNDLSSGLPRVSKKFK